VLPQSYEVPAAVVLVLGGALACFAGHRLFRIVLGIYGFILGAMLASSILGASNTIGMIAAAIVGGLVGALVLVFAYFVGIALVGAGLAALGAHLIWRQLAAGDPPPLAIIVVSVAGALAAMVLQRYVIIVGTSFAGAWTLLLGSLALASSRAAARLAASADVWILYPFSPSIGAPWVPFAWVGLGLAGTAVQLWLGGKRR
jgi:Domain of unknown function (DUF4203)